jgi:CHASE3 domain sensor protein
MAYRSYYKTPKSTTTQNTLKFELQNLQEELRELQTRSMPRRQNTNFADLEQFFMNKFVLIGGCILIGLGIGYLIFSSSKRRC